MCTFKGRVWWGDVTSASAERGMDPGRESTEVSLTSKNSKERFGRRSGHNECMHFLLKSTSPGFIFRREENF